MKINNKDALLKFINCDLNEPEFLKLNIEDLISLKDYMINLKKRKQIYEKELLDFKKEIKKETILIKEKFPWVYDIEPSFQFPFKIRLIAKEGYQDIYLHDSNDKNLWLPKSIVTPSLSIINYLNNHFSKSFKAFWDSEQRIINGEISKELNEINNKKDEMFKGKDRNFNYALLSSSESFRIFLHSNGINNISFITGPKNYNDVFISDFDDNLNMIENKKYQKDKISITSSEKKKLLNKIYVK